MSERLITLLFLTLGYGYEIKIPAALKSKAVSLLLPQEKSAQAEPAGFFFADDGKKDEKEKEKEKEKNEDRNVATELLEVMIIPRFFLS